jgi:LysM repeat protein
MAYQTYQVKSGDSLSKIASQLGLSSWQDLYNLNKSIIGSNPNLIRVGMTFNIPGTQAPQVPQPQIQAQAPGQSLAEQLTAGIKAPTAPQYEEVMPFYNAWERMVPQATESALSQIRPELQRQYKQNYGDYMRNMTSSGGERFGRALGGVGNLKAQTGRQEGAQLQDWLGQYRQGFQDLFYNPSRDAWNRAVTQGQTPDQNLQNIPTWNDVHDKYTTMYGQ